MYFLYLVVLRCDAMNVFPLIAMWKNPGDWKQVLVKKVLFIFQHTLALNIETISW